MCVYIYVCVYIYIYIYTNMMVVVLPLSHVQLCDFVDCGLPGSSDYEIAQARILDGVATSFSRGRVPTQGSNPHLLHCQAYSLLLHHQGSPAG